MLKFEVLGVAVMEPVDFSVVDDVDVSELADFYARQRHRTTQSPEKLRQMAEATFCFVTARKQGRLIGIARGVTDGVFGHLAECKLDPECQGPACVTRTDGRIEHDRDGIAKQMATRVIDALVDYGVQKIDVVAYGTEVDFCEELGFKKIGGMVALQLEVSRDVPAATALAR